MNTPAHLLIGAAVMGRSEQRLFWAALIGALLPDLSLYLLASAALFVMNIPPHVVFNELYYSAAWQQIFAIDNSFVIWGALCALAIWFRSGWAVALTGAAILHLALDFPLHHDDGRPHFWPLSDWVFESPYSYWDRAQGANWVAPLEASACIAAAIAVWVKKPGVVVSAVIAALLFAELYTVRTWLFVFENS